MNNTVQKWFENPEFLKLPFSTKKHTLSNYFDEELTNEKFYALPKTEQTRVRNNFVVMNMAPHMPEAPERGWIGDIGSALAGGVLGAAETGLRVARTVGDVFVGEEPEEEEWTTRGLEKLEDIRMSSPFLRPSKEARSGVRRWVYEGLQSTVQSILAQGPATAVGFFAMGGVPGAIAMYALSGGSLYGVAARDEFLERADARGIDRKVSEPAALKYALAEGGFEFATDLLEAATAGVARPFTRTGKEALKNGIKALLKQRASTIAARVGGVAAAETIGEMATAGTQAEIAHGVDLGDERFWSAAKNAFGPSLVAGLIFGGMGAGINTLQRRDVQQSLVNPGTDKKKRMQAVVAVGKELNSISPDIARVWTINAAEAVQDKKPISMDEDLVKDSGVKDEVSKDAPMGTNTQGVTEIGQNRSLEKQRIKREQDRAAEEELATDAAKAIVETDIKQAKAEESAAAEASLAEANQREIDRIWEEMQGAQVEAAAEEVQPASEGELVETETPGEVEITKRLTELEEVLSPGQISFIQNKVGQLGSPETVAAEFNADDNVSEYANLFAWMIDKEARKLEKTKLTEQKPADVKAIQSDLLRGPEFDDLGKGKVELRGESEIEDKEKGYAEETGKEIKEAGYKEGREGPTVKPLTKREKALQEYKAYTESLTPEQKDIVGDLIEDEPKSPSGQLFKIKGALAKTEKQDAEVKPGTEQAPFEIGDTVAVKKGWGDLKPGDAVEVAEINELNDVRLIKRVSDKETIDYGFTRDTNVEVITDEKKEVKTEKEPEARKESASSADISKNKVPDRMLGRLIHYAHGNNQTFNGFVESQSYRYTREALEDAAKKEGFGSLKEKWDYQSPHREKKEPEQHLPEKEEKTLEKSKKPTIIKDIDKPASEWSADELLAEWDRQAAEIEPAPEPTAKDKAKEAAEHVSNAIQAFKDINKILGERGSFSTEFNEDKWKQIKPLLKLAWDEILAAGKSGKEFVDIALKNLSPKGKPYFEKFVREEIQKETKDGTVTTSETGVQPLEGVSPKDSGKTEETRKAKDGTGRSSRDRKQRNVTDEAGTSEEVPGNRQLPGSTTNGKPDKTSGRGNRPSKIHTAPSRESRNYRITDKDQIGEGGKVAKAKQNISAISLLKKIESEKREATDTEKEQLVKYVGWGGIPQAFTYDYSLSHEERKTFKKIQEELKDLLTEEEYKAARSSTQNAHYTSPTVIKAMWGAMEKMGFKGGKVLEPGSGIAHFNGLMPKNIAANSAYTGIEKDDISGRISKLLYPDSNFFIEGYENTGLPDNFFDVTISNVPFADVKPYDPSGKYSKYKFPLHDFFFAKSMDKLRPGGIMMFITSRYTMDKQNKMFRKYMAERADFIGAIRLPETAFKQNAGTEVVTDIIILQKKQSHREPAKGPAWKELKPFKGKDDEIIDINEYYVQNPDMMLGQMALTGSMYAAKTPTLESDGRDLGEALKEALKKLPKGVYTEKKAKKAKELPQESIVPAPGDLKEGNYTVYEDKIRIKENNILIPVSIPKTPKNALDRVKGMIEIRGAARDTLRAQYSGESKQKIDASIKKLNNLYDKFVYQYGPLNDPVNEKLFQKDADASRLLALEKWDADTKTATKRDIFKGPVILKPQPVERADTADAALKVTLNERGGVDLDHMAKLTGKTQDEIIEDLKDILFFNPETEKWETKETYLSGNVKNKLYAAEGAAKYNPEYLKNVEALKAVQPKDLRATEITARLGSSWIPRDVAKDFLDEILEINSTEIRHSPETALWAVVIPVNGKNTTANKRKWGTADVGAHELLQYALNQQAPTVTKYDSQLKRRVIDPKATEAAIAKLEELKDEFENWVWKDQERRTRLLRIYNDTFNNTVEPKYDGSHLTLPGSNLNIQLRSTQKNAIWRIIQEGRALLHHVVGAGKTFTMIGAGMEMKRLGLINKPMYVVPNHMVAQFSKEFLELYPGANIMTIGPDDIAAKRRKLTTSKIATENWDGIIIRESSFTKIGVTPEHERKFIQQQIDELEWALLHAKNQEHAKGGRSIVKRLENAKDKKAEHLKKLSNRKSKDTHMYFEEMGVDFLFVDEAHGFKNLEFQTKIQVSGLGQRTNVQKTLDMYMKTQYLQSLNGGKKGVVFATGTPISNSVAEMYLMMRYLMGPELTDLKIKHFDGFAGTFAAATKQFEWSIDNTGYTERTRFREFVNVGELMQLYRKVADIVLAEDLEGVKLPKIKGGKAKMVMVPASEELLTLNSELSTLLANWKREPFDYPQGNPLNITGIGKKAALDMRLVSDNAPDDPNSKVNIAVGEIYKIWKSTAKDRSIQLIWVNSGTPGGNAKINLYDDIRKKLVKKGIPKKQIEFIHSYPKDEQKLQLFMRMRQGKSRILIGSTGKMGTGMNIQKRLVAAHHLEPDWRPADMEQRDGRIVRQGNENDEVMIFRYSTEQSFDTFFWQTLETKAGYIGQLLKSGRSDRTAEDIDKISAEYAEAMAITSGNPLVKEKITVDAQVRRLANLRQSYQESLYSMQDEARRLKEIHIPKTKKYIERLKADIKTRQDIKGDKFKIVIDGGEYNKRKKANKALDNFIKSHKGRGIHEVGEFAGFRVYLNRLISVTNASDAYSHCHLGIKGENTYEFNLKYYADYVAGLSSQLAKFEKELEDSQARFEKYNKDLPILEDQIKKPFKHEEDFHKAKTRQAEISKELSRIADDQAQQDTPNVSAEPDYSKTTKPSGDEKTEEKQYSTRTTPSLFEVNLDSIKSHPRFKSAKVTQGDDGVISVRFKSGLGFTVNSIDSVDENSVTLNADYGRYGLKPGEKVAGFYDHKDKNITIVEGVGDRYTIDHEFEHFLEKSGVLTPMDIAALNREVEKIGLTPNEETRARYLEEACRNRDAQTGHIARIIQKVIDFIDMIINQFHRTARGVLRDIESGKIGDRAALGDKINEFAPSAAYSVKEAVKKITDNPRFAKWFGDSKVVDENGEPLVVYHGTTMDFTAFDPAKRGARTGLDARHGFFFAGKPEIASEYAKEFGKDAKGGQVMPVYLSLQNPLQVDYNSQRVDHSKLEKVIKFAKQKGHDGVVVHNIKDGAIEDNQYVAFDPNQIKSIFNKGSFDPNNPNVLYSTKEHVTYSTGLIPSGQEVARDIQEDRSFANRIFEQRDVAVHRAQVEVQDLQKKVQALAGKKSRRRHPLGFAYDKRLQRSRESDALDMALMVWRDLQINPDKADEFKTWADGALKDPEASREQKLSIKRQLSLLDRALNLTDEQKALADEIGELFDKAYTVAKANKVVSAFRDNYVRRIWKVPKGKEGHFFSSGSTCYGFKTFTTAKMQRKLETILDGWMAGYELGIKGLTNSYGTYLQELETILANKDFIVQGYHTRDIEGLRLFSTSRKGSYSDYVELKAPGFKVWEWAGKVATEVEPDEEGALLVDDYGRKFFYGAIEKLPETWAVYKVQDGKKSKKALRVFESEEDAEAFATGKDYETSIEYRSAKEFAEAWEERKLYAPKPLADIINKMTASDRLFSGIPGLDAMARFNAGMKSWILLSSFFHHMAGARSWVFGVHHGWKKKRTKNPITGEMMETAGANPVAAYKAGLKKIEDRHAIIELGVKNGLTLGEMQDWSERALRKETGFAETLANKLGLARTSKVMERGRFYREKFTDSLFKKYFAGLKAEAFTMEFIHELQKAQDAWTQGKGKRPDIDAVAERTARLINADFGGLHLQRMGRNPTVQKMARLLLLAPDWTESNFRTVTGMVPGLNKWINKTIGDIPAPAGMDKIYRKFWGRVALRIAVSTVISQMLLNGTDDSEDFWKEQALSNRFNKYRWTEVEVSKIYRALGIDTEAARKTLSLGGHFFDPLKLFDPASLIKHKASPAVRVAEAVMSGSDWAERPFTGVNALFGTRQTIKKSPHEEKEGFYSRLPATVVNQVTNLQPVQVGYFLRYLQGEQDGLTAILRSMGTSVHTAWPAKITTPITKGDGEDRVYEAVKDLMDKSMLHMGPPAGKITVGGILRNLTREQYQDYIEKSSELSRVKLQATILSSKWKLMAPERQAAAIETVIKSARKKIRARLKKKIWRDFMIKNAA